MSLDYDGLTESFQVMHVNKRNDSESVHGPKNALRCDRQRMLQGFRVVDFGDAVTIVLHLRSTRDSDSEQ